jgi:hypothetical protein
MTKRPDHDAPLVIHHELSDGRSMITLTWDGHEIQCHRSATGRSFRVWVDGKEAR